MAGHKKSGRHVASLDDRFTFVGDAIAPGDQAALKPAFYEVEDRANGGAPRSLKLWRKIGSEVDGDLRELWRHEMRQLQRVMSYAGAQDIIVNILEFVEDADYFGVLLDRAGHPLAAKARRVHRHHWLHDLTAIRARTLFWKNLRRVALALGIVHRQGLVHGRLSADVVMTEGAGSRIVSSAASNGVSGLALRARSIPTLSSAPPAPRSEQRPIRLPRIGAPSVTLWRIASVCGSSRPASLSRQARSGCL